MKPIRFCLLAALALLAAFLAYRSLTSPNRLNVDPHAAREIDNAKKH